MSDIDRENQGSNPVQITNEAEDKKVDIVTINGTNRLATDSNISSINVPLGKDPLPDTFFYITNAGQIGDTVTIDIAATANDTSTPDADFPAYQLVYALVAADVGDERQLSINIAEALNNDPLFEAQELEAQAIGDDGDGNRRAAVFITSTKFSLNGEFYERPNYGDFNVTTTGTTTIQFFTSEHTRIVSRPKEVSLARDPRNPHRLGVQNISGTVFIRSSDPEAFFRERLGPLNVNGSVTPAVFELVANPAGGKDKIIDSLKGFATDTNIKVQDGQFLGNPALTNGVLIEFIRDGIAIFTGTIRNTPDFLSFATSASDNKIIGQAGGDYIESTFSLVDTNLAFVLRAGKDDKLRITVRDNLTAIDSFYAQVAGSED